MPTSTIQPSWIDEIAARNILTGLSPLQAAAERDLAQQEERRKFAQALQVHSMDNDARLNATVVAHKLAAEAAAKQGSLNRDTELERTRLAHELSAKERMDILKETDANKDKDKLDALRRDATAYGVKLPAGATEEDYINGIQEKAGKSLGAVYRRMSQLESELSAADPNAAPEAAMRINLSLAQDPSLQKALEDKPDVLAKIVNNQITPDQVLAEVGKSNGFFDTESKRNARKQSFEVALARAKSTLAQQALENPDARKRPGYLQKLEEYKTLADSAQRLHKDIRNPDYYQQALSQMQNPITQRAAFNQSAATQAGAPSALAASYAARTPPLVPQRPAVFEVPGLLSATQSRSAPAPPATTPAALAPRFLRPVGDLNQWIANRNAMTQRDLSLIAGDSPWEYTQQPAIEYAP